jgi:glutamyl-tRNA reductase
MVISSTSSSEYILRYKDLYELLTVNRKKTLFILDIAVPGMSILKLEKSHEYTLYNIDDINRVIQDNLRLRTAEWKKCEKIIEIEYLKFLNWYMTLSIAPVIQGLSDKINNICQCEINRAIKQNQQLDEAQQKFYKE